jgi:hypothetical protein
MDSFLEKPGLDPSARLITAQQDEASATETGIDRDSLHETP